MTPYHWILLIVEVAVLTWLCVIFVSGVHSSFAGAPYVPTRPWRVKRILDFAGLKTSDVFYDLGCGDGRMVIAACQKFHVAKSIGYEATLWPSLKARLLIRAKKISGAEIHRANILKIDCSPATFVYLYLFPEIVDSLAAKLAEELQSGTRVMSVSFPIDTARHPEFTLKKTQKIDSITAYLYERT
ncbi:MAG TPA: SAM-dependent methyltransferase [Candidatus Paceibacterota bacterium]|nr:SAM-dependent methyltransferase [Candidatus Paceibacterota bacterium]